MITIVHVCNQHGKRERLICWKHHNRYAWTWDIKEVSFRFVVKKEKCSYHSSHQTLSKSEGLSFLHAIKSSLSWICKTRCMQLFLLVQLWNFFLWWQLTSICIRLQLVVPFSRKKCHLEYTTNREIKCWLLSRKRKIKKISTERYETNLFSNVQRKYSSF